MPHEIDGNRWLRWPLLLRPSSRRVSWRRVPYTPAPTRAQELVAAKVAAEAATRRVELVERERGRLQQSLTDVQVRRRMRM
jgi:hypothetical protein